MAWTDRYLSIRDRWLSSPRFQRWAASFPLTRPTARKRAKALFDVCAGFVYSQILYACVQLKLFDLLAAGPQSAVAIAEQLNVPLESMERLLEAAISLQLVDKRLGNKFGLGALGAAMVGNPGVSAMVEHHRLLYADLSDPVGLLRGELDQTELARYWAYASAKNPAALRTPQTSDYTALMGNSLALVADEILDAYPLQKHQRLLDVGGGDGSFLIAAAARSSALQLLLFDLPPVAERAAQRFAQLGLQARASTLGGNFLTDELPPGADIISLVRVIHDHPDEDAQRILQRAHRALPAAGVLLLAEPMMHTPGAAPVGDAYFGFYLLAMGRGKPRSPEVLREMLKSAGFATSQMVPTRQPLQCRLIVAHKSGEKSV